MRSRIFSFLLLCTVLSFSCLALAILYASPPTVTFLVEGAYLAQDFRSTCGPAACYYYRAFETPVSLVETRDALVAHQWHCTEIESDNDGNRFTQVPPPYWQCEGDAFPYGSATLWLTVSPIDSTRTRMKLHVLWDPG